jgi:hypothetical protein
MKNFKINKYITLKLIGDKTVIYINEEEFKQCKHLLIVNLEINDKHIKYNSIDEFSSKNNNRFKPEDLNILPDQEFIAHCSNLQAWVEHGYDTRILHSKLAFPLLKRLGEVGDQYAKTIFKEEIAKRLESGYLPVIEYLIKERYINFLNKEELLFALLEPNDAEIIHFLVNSLKKDRIEPLTSFEDAEMVLNYFVVKNKKIIGLHLEHLSTPIFTKELFEKLTNLTSLQVLEISHTNIESVPDSLYNLQELKILKLNEVSISGSLPEAIVKITSLEILDLSRNLISSIPDNIKNLTNLRRLYLELNKINSIPDSINKLHSLEILSLEGNNIKALPEPLGDLKNLREINLARNGLEELPYVLGELLSLKILKLHGNNLTSLPDIFYKLDSLHTIFLNNNNIGIEEYITRIFCKKAPMKALRNLFLDKNQIDKLSADCNMIKKNNIIKIYI